ncbi:hypothetical protein K502DRAFT_332103 [Neoconidiobolus thromboides FSU 785]|nr:hypothetical protein K502DRAFT_332103 [Neoconidiobolus thromboides FSU 785]
MNSENYNTSRKKRKVLNIHIKKEIVRLAEEGATHKDLAEMYDIGRSTVTKIILRKDEILNYEILENDPRKCFRKNKDEKLESILYTWCTEGQNIDFNNFSFVRENIEITDIASKAISLANELNINLDHDLNWAKKFLRKFKLKLKKHNKNSELVVGSNVPENFNLNLETPISCVNIVNSFDTYQNFYNYSYETQTNIYPKHNPIYEDNSDVYYQNPYIYMHTSK